MSRRDLTSFQKTRLALAVAALSASLGACSTVPRDDGFDGRVADAGRESAETGPGLWDRTLYLLGFGETAGADAERRRAASEPRLAGATDDARRLDEVDIAMAREDAVMPSSRAADVVDSPAWADTAALGERSDEELFDGERVLVENRVDGETMPVSASELTHEVGDSETLWDIAKKTTGDATNWHVLADVNDLAPDARVYPGQTIVVPADMVRPELVGFTTTAEADAASGSGAGAAGEEADAVDTLAAAGTAVDAATTDADAADRPETDAEILAAEVRAEVDAATGDTAETGGTELRLGAGETLWDFAKRTTGDATNWRAIAEANGFSEEQATKVYENMRITVPTALLRDDAPSGEVEASETLDVADAAEALEETLEEETAEEAMVPIADAADALETRDAGTETARAGDEQPIRIVEAAYRSETGDLVSGAATDDAAASAAALATERAAESVAEGTAPDEIMVSGTYYPKAVYNDADFSSSLLMRVSPGTKLLVSRAVGSWYEVATEQGTGYVHARDIK